MKGKKQSRKTVADGMMAGTAQTATYSVDLASPTQSNTSRQSPQEISDAS